MIRMFVAGERLLQASLFARLRKQYSSVMSEELAKTLAAQVVNHLKGDDFIAVMHNSPEPLKTAIWNVKDQVRVRADEAMLRSRETREAIVALLRVHTVIELMLQGEAFFSGELRKRIEGLLITYGREFPEEIRVGQYLKIALRYQEETERNGFFMEMAPFWPVLALPVMAAGGGGHTAAPAAGQRRGDHSARVCSLLRGIKPWSDLPRRQLGQELWNIDRAWYPV